MAVEVVLLKHERDYIEGELFNYKYYNEKIEELRESLVLKSPFRELNVQTSGISNPTAKKAMDLLQNKALNRLKDSMDAIDGALALLSQIHKELFDRYYFKEQSYVQVFMEMNISQSYFYKIRREIIFATAVMLGIVTLQGSYKVCKNDTLV